MEDVVIAALFALIMYLLFLKKDSEYSASTPLGQRLPSFVSYISNTWKDVPTPLPANFISADIYNQYSLDIINKLMWMGTSVPLTSGGTVSLPSGVTTTNVVGFRKQISSSGGNPIGGPSFYWITNSLPTTFSMSRACSVGAVWVKPDTTRVSLPDYYIMRKSIIDPRPDPDCVATETNPVCSGPCGSTGSWSATVGSFVTGPLFNASSSVCQATSPNNIPVPRTATVGSTITGGNACPTPACGFASVADLANQAGITGAVGGYCTQNSDCVNGTICISSTCQNCVLTGEYTANGNDCCSGRGTYLDNLCG